jgi:hypothetical protein
MAALFYRQAEMEAHVCFRKITSACLICASARWSRLISLSVRASIVGGSGSLVLVLAPSPAMLQFRIGSNTPKRTDLTNIFDAIGSQLTSGSRLVSRTGC